MVAILRGKRGGHRMTSFGRLDASKVDSSRGRSRFETGQERGNYETREGDL